MEEYSLLYLHHTDKAILLTDTDEEHGEWFPLSQVELIEDLETLDSGDCIIVSIPEWLAINHGLE